MKSRIRLDVLSTLCFHPLVIVARLNKATFAKR